MRGSSREDERLAGGARSRRRLPPGPYRPRQPSPVHGRPGNRSYIEYDYRFKTGELKVLEHLGEHFPAPPPASP